MYLLGLNCLMLFSFEMGRHQQSAIQEANPPLFKHKVEEDILPWSGDLIFLA